jgi:hypothetical protein
MAARRFNELVGILIGSIKSNLEKNEIVGVYTNHALEDFDFIFESVGRQLSDTERQELVSLLFDTIAEVADAATTENIDLMMIQTYKSITLPIRTQEVDIISRWFAQHARSIEEYFLAITHAYHVYTITYYTIILVPHFKHKLCIPVSPKELYLTTVSSSIRPLILKHYYQKIVADPQNTEIIRNFFNSYAQLMFVKLLYLMYINVKTENVDECRIYMEYITEQDNNLRHKYSFTYCAVNPRPSGLGI